ncbi:MAG TPA: D-alanine--D-alanine ligase [Phycisphaerae bacterium]|nr:D-alanine--D-alanine ligase [Phycisphaerae bacterium]
MRPRRNATEGTQARTLSGPLDVTVLMGGPSSERDISLLSGAAVADALDRTGHRVTRADISPGDTSALDRRGIDVVFIALHGDFGESGQVQALCEARGLRYTGSGPRSSELAMDKAASKQLLKQAGLATPDWMIIEEFHPPALYKKWLEEIPPPLFLKPVDGGSSVDVIFARSEEERDSALELLLDKYGRAMLERYVKGPELTVSILGHEALPVLEIRVAGDFYDYHAKYDDDAGTRYIFDHGLPDDTCRAVQADALKAHDSLGCRDMSRVDFILDSSGTPQVLEINTIPGFTSHSLLPMAAKRVGISFEQLVNRLVEMAMSRPAPRANRPGKGKNVSRFEVER